jgi:hypothetical protein
MNAAAANASAKAAVAHAEEAMDNVQAQVTQVLKQTNPEVPLGSPAKEVQPEEAMENVQVQVIQVLKQTKPEVPLGSTANELQPEAQLEPTAKENILAATADMAALIATMQTMQHDMQKAMLQDMQQTMQNAISVLQTNVQT